MNNLKYNIKLYGYTGDDPDAFCRTLARVLELPAERARDLLKQVPIVILEAVDYQKADKIHALLIASQGLVIMEPIYDAETGPQAAAVHEPDVLPYYPDLEEDKEDVSLRWWIWTSLLAGLSGILVLFIIISFVSTYIQTDRRQRPDLAVSATEEASADLNTDAEELSPETQSLIADIYPRIEMLQSSIPDLQARVTEAQNDRDLDDRRTIVMDLQREIRSHRKEIRKLKLKLQNLEDVPNSPNPLP